jgi:hypothetical protein
MTLIKETKNLAKNPLGIIALFISFVYAMAFLIVGVARKSPTPNQRLPLLWFLIVFPILIIVCFVYLVIIRQSKLYAPSYFKDESNFIKTFEYKLATTNYIAKNEQEMDEIDKLLSYSSTIGLFLYA